MRGKSGKTEKMDEDIQQKLLFVLTKDAKMGFIGRKCVSTEYELRLLDALTVSYAVDTGLVYLEFGHVPIGEVGLLSSTVTSIPRSNIEYFVEFNADETESKIVTKYNQYLKEARESVVIPPAQDAPSEDA